MRGSGAAGLKFLSFFVASIETTFILSFSSLSYFLTIKSNLSLLKKVLSI